MEIMKEVKKVVLASAIVTGAVSTVTQVKADETKAPDPIPGTEQKTSEKNSQVTAADVALSQVSVNEAAAAVKAQEEVTNAAQAEVTAAEKSVNEATETVAQAEATVKEATPENIGKAQADVTVKEKDEKRAQAELKTAESNQKQAESDTADQEAKVAEAAKKLTEKEGEVTAAEKVVAEKQAILDGTGVAEVVAKAETAKHNLEASKEAVSQAQIELTAAKQADQTEAQYQAAKENLAKTQSVLESLNIPSITYPAGYAAALKAYFENPTEANSNALNEIAKKGMAAAGYSTPDGGKTYYSNPASPFKASQADKQVVIEDVNQLSAKVQEELAAFNAQLINDFRRLMGTDDIPVLVNRDMQKVAQKATQLSTNQYGHDQDALNAAAKEVGLNQGNQGLLSENIGYQSADDVVTLANLKEQAYNNLVMMLFYDKHADWGHALNFAGLDRESVMLQYIGVATRKLDRGLVAMHYVGTDSKTIHLLKDQLHQDVKIDTKNNLASIQDRIQEAQKAVSQAQKTFTAAQAANDTAQTTKNEAQVAYHQAEATAKQAVAQRDAIQNTALKTPEAQAKLGQAKAELVQADLENKSAQAALSQLNADVQTKRKVLAAAKEKLAGKQAEWKTLNEALTAEKAVLATKQAKLAQTKEMVTASQNNLKDVQNSLTVARERVEILKNAPQLLEKAKASLVSAQELLKEKKSALEAAQAKLAAAKATQSKIVAAHKELLAAYRAYLEAQHQAQLEAERQEMLAAQKAGIEKAEGGLVGKSNLVKYADSKEQDQVAKVADPIYQAPAAPVPASLPKTGQASSSLGLFGLVTAALLGVLKSKRKKLGNKE